MLINFLSFVQLSPIRKKMIAPTLSLPSPDHHSFFNHLFFQISTDFMSFKCWNRSFTFEAQNVYLKKSNRFCEVIFLRIPSPALLCTGGARKSLTRFPLPHFLAYLCVSGGISGSGGLKYSPTNTNFM